MEEGGGGESEGFEQAEEELIEGASHGDPQPDPAQRAASYAGGESDSDRRRTARPTKRSPRTSTDRTARALRHVSSTKISKAMSGLKATWLW